MRCICKYTPNHQTVTSLASRPFASAFTLGRGGGKVWRLLTRFHGLYRNVDRANEIRAVT